MAWGNKAAWKGARANKHNAKKVTVDGIRFDSKKEARRYQQLKMLERAGEISNLRLQVKYYFEVNGGLVTYDSGRKMFYKADFVYHDEMLGQEVVEDVKGQDTDASKIKRALFAAVYGKRILIT